MAILWLLVSQASFSSAQQDTTRGDSTKQKTDTSHVLPEVHRVNLPDQEERLTVAGVGLAILSGFLILMILKKRAADRFRGD